MIEFLKKRHRTLLELWSGIIAPGIVIQIVGIFFTKNQLIYALSLWLGIGMAILSSYSIYKSLDKALDYPEAVAKKKIYMSYSLRYLVLIVIFAALCITNVLYPLVTFLGYMMLKAGALLQPYTHKIYNKIFNETDPVPMTEEEYQASLQTDRQDSVQEENPEENPEGEAAEESAT